MPTNIDTNHLDAFIYLSTIHFLSFIMYIKDFFYNIGYHLVKPNINTIGIQFESTIEF